MSRFAKIWAISFIKGDIDITLRVFYYLRRFSNLNRRGTEHTTGRYRTIECRNPIKYFRSLACDNFGDFLNRMLSITY